MSLKIYRTIDEKSKDISGTNPLEWNNYLKSETAHCYPGEGLIRDPNNIITEDDATIFPECNAGKTNAPCCAPENALENIGYVLVAGNKVKKLNNVTEEGVVDEIKYTSEDPKNMQIVFKKWFDILKKNNKLASISFETDTKKIPPAGLCHLLRNPNAGVPKDTTKTDSTKFGQEVKISLIWQIAAEQHVLATARLRDVPFHVVALDYGTGTGKTAIIARCVTSMCSTTKLANKSDNAYVCYVLWNQTDKKKLQSEVKNLLPEALIPGRGDDNFQTANYINNFYDKSKIGKSIDKGQDLFAFSQNIKQIDLPENGIDTAIDPINGRIEAIYDVLVKIKYHYIKLLEKRQTNKLYMYKNNDSVDCRIAIFIDEAHAYMDQGKDRYRFITELRDEILNLQSQYESKGIKSLFRVILLSANISDVAKGVKEFSTVDSQTHLSVLRFSDIPMPFRADVRLAKQYIYNVDSKQKIDYGTIHWEDRNIHHTGANLFAEALRRCAILYAKNKIENKRRIKQVIVFSSHDNFFNDAIDAYKARLQSATGLTINSTKNYINGEKDPDSYKYGNYITNIFSPPESLVPAVAPVPAPIAASYLKKGKGSKQIKQQVAPIVVTPPIVPPIVPISGPDQSSIGFEFYKVNNKAEADAIKSRFGTLDDLRDEKLLYAYGSHDAYANNVFPKTEILALDLTATGINLAGVSAVHFLGPPRDYTDFIQTVARGIRLCSSIGFDANEQQLEIYMYGTGQNIEDLKNSSQTSADILTPFQVDGEVLSAGKTEFAKNGTDPLPNNKLLFEMAQINYKNKEMESEQPIIFLNSIEDILIHFQNFISISPAWISYLKKCGKSNRKKEINLEELSIQLIRSFSNLDNRDPRKLRIGFEEAENILLFHEKLITDENFDIFCFMLTKSYDAIPLDKSKFFEIKNLTSLQRIKNYLYYPDKYILLVCPRNIEKTGTFYEFVNGKVSNLIHCYGINDKEDGVEMMDMIEMEQSLARIFFWEPDMFQLLLEQKMTKNTAIDVCIRLFLNPYDTVLNILFGAAIDPDVIHEQQNVIRENCLKFIQKQNVYAISKLNLFDEKKEIWMKVNREFLNVRKFSDYYVLYYYEQKEDDENLKSELKKTILLSQKNAADLINTYFKFLYASDETDAIKEKIASALGVWRMYHAHAQDV